jgi:hypothetical protein
MTCNSDAIREQAPTSHLDYGFNWATAPLETGETLASSTWDVDPVTVPPLVLDNPGLIMPDGTEATGAGATRSVVWASGGLAGQDYTVTNRVVTTMSRGDSRSFVLRVQEVLG